jgi:glycosyltransferase involved in cell wall biosynthesis
MTNPLVSIGIPTFNRLHSLRDALASVLVVYPFEVEIIVSDDGSSAELGDYVRQLAAADPRLRYLRNERNLGMVPNWNVCLKAARGKWFKLLCDDDQLVPGALVKEVALAESRPDIALVSGLSLEVQEAEFKSIDRESKAHKVGLRTAGVFTQPTLLRQMVFSENIIGPPPAVLFRREFLPAFNPIFEYAADWAAWVVLVQKGSLVATAQPSCFFRLHTNNLTKHFVQTNVDFIEVFALRLVALKKTGSVFLGLAFSGVFFYRVLRRFTRLALLLEWRAMILFVGAWPKIVSKANDFLISIRN